MQPALRALEPFMLYALHVKHGRTALPVLRSACVSSCVPTRFPICALLSALISHIPCHCGLHAAFGAMNCRKLHWQHLMARCGGVFWGNDDLALLYESEWKTRRSVVYTFAPGKPEQGLQVLFDRSAFLHWLFTVPVTSIQLQRSMLQVSNTQQTKID